MCCAKHYVQWVEAMRGFTRADARGNRERIKAPCSLRESRIGFVLRSFLRVPQTFQVLLASTHSAQ